VLRTVRAIRYVTPLREGGSLPAVVEADDDGTYVLEVPRRGAGAEGADRRAGGGRDRQGAGTAGAGDRPGGAGSHPRALRAGLRNPGSDPGQRGHQPRLDYLPGALAFHPLVRPSRSRLRLGGRLVRRLRHQRGPDGPQYEYPVMAPAPLAHRPRRHPVLPPHLGDYLARSLDPFAPVRDHVLLPFATEVLEADARLAPRLNSSTLREIVDAVPDAWLGAEPGFDSAEEHRAAYLGYLLSRLQASSLFVEEAIRARALLV